MGVQNKTVVILTGSGGSIPYTFQVISDSSTTIPAVIAGNQMTVDATSLSPGTYSVHVRTLDALGNTKDSVLPVVVADPNVFTILNDNVAYQPSSLPLTVNIPLVSYGGSGSVVWSLIPSLTTAPGATINSSNQVVYTITSYGTWTIAVTATDAIGNALTKVFEIEANSFQAYALVDGQVEILVNVPTTKTGTHAFTLTATDSTGLTAVRKTFNYNAATSVTTIDEEESFADHVWANGDATTVVLPVLGDLTGFTLGNPGSMSTTNGLTVTIDPVTSTVAFSGPPTSFGNSQFSLGLPIMRNSTQVALVTREFTLLSHSGITTIGSLTCTPIPYKVGDLIGLNPFKPYFNSPHYSLSSDLIVSVAPGQLLPAGLSLDSTTGLIYGTLAGTGVPQSVLNYSDSTGILNGSVTINWDTQTSAFSLIDATVVGQLQVPYSASFTNSGANALTTATIYRGRLPQGLSVGITNNGTSMTIAGTPTEAGVFDVWFKVTNQAKQSALIYKRFAVSYIKPLTILTTGLYPILTNVAYNQPLAGFGGVAPYTWSIVGPLPTGITLNASTGQISGTTTVSTYSQTLSVSLTDSRSVTTTQSFLLTVNNTLQIDTTSLPLITPSQFYSYQLKASGGVPSYIWSLAPGSPALPGGLTLSSSGLLSGASNISSYSESVVFKVTDTSNNIATASIAVAIGTTASILIDTSGIGPVDRGNSYHGSLAADGSGVAPYTWSVTTTTPNALPTGLVLSTDPSTQGATATLSGSTTASFSNLSVEVQVVDANGNSAVAFLFLSTYSTLAITTTSLPIGETGGSYSVQLAATGVNTPFAWSLDGSSASLPSGYSLSNTGLLSGITSSTYSGNIAVDVTDSLGDIVSKTFNLSIQVSNLSISTTTLSPVIAGRLYSATLASSGGIAPNTWSLDSSSPTLPSGITLDPATGIISGITTSVGYTQTLIVRLTDSTGYYVTKAVALVVNSGLTLFTGVDYTDGFTTGYLGYETNGDVTSINPRPNYSFYAVATGVIATNVNQPVVTVPAGFTATIQSIVGGVAFIQLSGPFSSGIIGDNAFPIVFVDTGVTATANFLWKVLNSNTIRLAPSSGSIPLTYVDV
jgi:hypothetical protein